MQGLRGSDLVLSVEPATATMAGCMGDQCTLLTVLNLQLWMISAKTANEQICK